MKTVLDNFVNEEVIESEENKPKIVENGQILVVTEIVNIEKKEYKFDDRVVNRYIYTLQNGDKVIIPVSVHKSIIEYRKEMGDSLEAIKIKKEGSGINTKYLVFPTST